ncbi:sucrase ferredoxin [Chroogloeocystis siderophila]|uniref:sucrase ferredoxin n=1 Tax=Chroogloeocystis siderophila TaxID=329163 RepID=UPI001F1E1579|nr:sucrase ferredoxin [Chroogloeocystis siderophila]
MSKANGEDLIGWAHNFDRYLLIEMPLPWSEDLWEKGDVLPQAVVDKIKQVKASGTSLEPLVFCPDQEYSHPDYTRILYYDRPAQQFAQFRKQEFVVPTAKLTDLVTALLDSSEHISEFESCRQNSDRIREFFVCTHGNVDAACAKFGFPIYRKLRSEYVPASHGNLRVWRVSHFGGHQFAPTLIDFPEGRYWGRLEPEMLDLLVWRQGKVSELRPFYRGWAGLGWVEQIAEREIWMQEGWDWINYLKIGKTLAIDSSDEDYPDWVEVRIDFTSVDGSVSGAYEARIEAKGTVKTMWTSGKDQPLWEVKQYCVNRLNRVD